MEAKPPLDHRKTSATVIGPQSEKKVTLSEPLGKVLDTPSESNDRAGEDRSAPGKHEVFNIDGLTNHYQHRHQGNPPLLAAGSMTFACWLGSLSYFHGLGYFGA